ncbi:MAG: hypothetical protein M1814_001966 [Vezdaea aestivalis]|nr:MAG: hypothetical protein M1814_001966 [Vezdaea aestivalis]
MHSGSSSLDSEVVKSKIEAAGALINEGDPETSLRSDVLRIEFSGPEENFQITDIPGLVGHRRTERDITPRISREIIQSYVNQPRMIILGVVDAVTDFDRTHVFDLIDKADKEGDRTVGVVTKCDQVQNLGEEGLFALMSNSKDQGCPQPLTHGWFAVCNRSPEDVQAKKDITAQYETEEDMFKDTRWSPLPADRKGARRLRLFLSRLLNQHVKQEFPKIKSEIIKKRNAVEAALEKLGEHRDTVQAQRFYVARIIQEYQELARNALNDGWSSSNLPLQPAVRKSRVDFTNQLATAQLKYPLGHPDKDIAHNAIPKNASPPSFGPSPPVLFANYQYSNSGKVIENDTYDPVFDESACRTYEWIDREVAKFSGAELPGQVDPRIIQTLFQQQTQHWATLAQSHIEEVGDRVKRHSNSILQKICGDQDMLYRLKKYLDGVHEEAMSAAKNELKDLLDDELEQRPLTFSPLYRRELDSCRTKRNQQLFKQFTADKKRTFDIHDELVTYTLIAQARFGDNVCMQAVQRHLLGRKGPLGAFSTAWLSKLSDEEIQTLGGESKETIAERQSLMESKKKLDEALKEIEKA